MKKEELFTGDYFGSEGDQWHYFIPEKYRSVVLTYYKKGRARAPALL